MTPEIERFVTRDLPVGKSIPNPLGIENGMFRSEILQLWKVCEMLKTREQSQQQTWYDPMTFLGGMKAYPHIAKALFYWRRGEGWRIKRRPRWIHTLKKMFPKTLKDA